jgi:hypothetical protein
MVRIKDKSEIAQESAYHEAGHCIIGSVFLGRPEKIDISGSYTDFRKLENRIGHIQLPAIVFPLPISIFCNTIYLLSGKLAEWKYENDDMNVVKKGLLNTEMAIERLEEESDFLDADDTTADFPRLERILEENFVTYYGQGSIKRYSVEAACDILNDQLVWDKTTEIAEIIFKKTVIEGEDMDELFDKALSCRPPMETVVSKFAKKISRFKRKNRDKILNIASAPH